MERFARKGASVPHLRPLWLWTAMAIALASPGAAGAPPSLIDAYDAAWQQQPEARTLPAWRQAVAARADAAASWLAAPLAVELNGQSDRFGDDLGSREYGIALSFPLWLWDERTQSQRLAGSESDALTTATAAAMLRLAGEVRSRWWQWQRTLVELALAQEQALIATRLVDDVQQRLLAGDLTQADHHQAKSELLAALNERGDAELAMLQAQTQLMTLTAWPETMLQQPSETPASEALPPLPASLDEIDPAHPHLAALLAQIELAKNSQALLATRSRANPELTLGAVTERDSHGEDYQPALQLAIRIPLGGGSRHQAELATASAVRLGLEADAALRRQQLLGEIAVARQAVAIGQEQAIRAAEQARLAVENAGFQRRAFELGESDLPTQLRLLRERGAAVRAARLTAIAHAEAISQLRQALGLLPQ